MSATMSPDLLNEYRALVCEPQGHNHPITPRAMAECCNATWAKLDAEG